jgi:L-histidine Nalpha-methyltransferase
MLTRNSRRDRLSVDSTGQFRADVLRGLRAPAPYLPSKYFYDAAGSELFEQITALDEYYLTRTELAIMREHAGAMAGLLGPHCLLIEYGSGASAKTRLLLDHAKSSGRRLAAYVPIDLSGSALFGAAAALAQEYPGVEVLPVCADFTRPVELPAPRLKPARNVVYFPGSTIGNFTPDEAAALLGTTHSLCGPGGGLLLGADLQKDVRLLEAAYNDRKGVTAAFNLNLLARINRELGGNFDLDRFEHRAFYDAAHGRIEMHLVSRCTQCVNVGDVRFWFAAGASIRTEYSYKYTEEGLRALAASCGFTLQHSWTDRYQHFSVYYFTVVDGRSADAEGVVAGENKMAAVAP